MSAPRLASWATIAEHLYRLSLLSYPVGFRREYGRDAVELFGDLYREAYAEGGLRSAIGMLWRCVARAILYGLRERIDATRESVRKARWAGESSGYDDYARKRTLEDRMEKLVQDLRYAARTLIKKPAFSLATVLLVALGVGATTAIFSVVDSVLLRPLPYPHSDRLISVSRDGSSVPLPDYVDWRDGLSSFEAWGAVWTISRDLTGEGEPERLEVAQITPQLFSILGAQAQSGRLLAPDDWAAGAEGVAVLSHELWQRRWGGDPGVIGGTISVGEAPYTVTGVLHSDFVPPEVLDLADAGVYVPLDLNSPDLASRNMYALSVVARLGSGTSFAAARAEVDATEIAFAEAYPESYRARDGSLFGIEIRTLMEATVGDIGGTLQMFLGAVALMLLIACANVANLFLARGTDREHEIALRSALGAGRGRIMTQLLTESVALAVVGGALGIAVAYWGVEAFRVLNPGGVPRLAEVTVDLRILGFAFALATLTGISFGIVPAASSASVSAQAALREGSSHTTLGRRRFKFRSALVVAEIGLALVLLVGAGLLFNSFLRLRDVETGFDPEQVITMSLNLESGYEGEEITRFAQALLEQIDAEPGVVAAGASWRLPFFRGRCCWRTRVRRLDGADSVVAFIHPVTPGYFQALGIGFLQGRAFTPSDVPPGYVVYDEPTSPGGTVPVVLNRSVADRLFPNGDAVGQPLEVSRRAELDIRVVGVVDDFRHWTLDADAGVHLYVPYSTFANWIGYLDVAARYEGPAGSMSSAMQRAVRRLDPNLPLGEIATMEQRISRSITTPRFYTALLMTFAIIAFALAAGGIYSSMLYTVGQRQREVGIRLALGAQAGDVAWMVVRHGTLLTGIGIAIGLAAALLFSRILESFVFGITTTDTATFAAVSFALAIVALTACYFPARRAAATDPIQTLRME